ncbi:hypothetical protein EDB83DRAFT_2319556 [Lactarius deliciosus]|nr:hypothetical protein EDB83DRAFT_2319556 [Lactarius deliciosus]
MSVLAIASKLEHKVARRWGRGRLSQPGHRVYDDNFPYRDTFIELHCEQIDARIALEDDENAQSIEVVPGGHSFQYKPKSHSTQMTMQSTKNKDRKGDGNGFGYRSVPQRNEALNCCEEGPGAHTYFLSEKFKIELSCLGERDNDDASRTIERLAEVVSLQVKYATIDSINRKKVQHVCSGTHVPPDVSAVSQEGINHPDSNEDVAENLAR